MNLPALILALVLTAPNQEPEFKIVPNSMSPDKSVALAARPGPKDEEVVFFDVAKKAPLSGDLSTEPGFDAIAMAQESDENRPNYKIIWNSDSRRMAIFVGFHQLTSVTAYELRDTHPTQLAIPDLQSQWEEIGRQIRPFRITKRWTINPVWPKKDCLSFTLGGSSIQNEGQGEGDYLEFSFRVIVQFDDQGHGTVIGLESEK
jgi:hypothetical protein